MTAAEFLAARGWRPAFILGSGGRTEVMVPVGSGHGVRMIVQMGEVERLARELGWQG